MRFRVYQPYYTMFLLMNVKCYTFAQPNLEQPLSYYKVFNSSRFPLQLQTLSTKIQSLRINMADQKIKEELEASLA